MKKGFTLIELLAVIVILGILALILIPVINNVIEKSRMSAFRESVNNIISSGSNFVGDYLINNSTNAGVNEGNGKAYIELIDY